MNFVRKFNNRQSIILGDELHVGAILADFQLRIQVCAIVEEFRDTRDVPLQSGCVQR